MDRDELDDRIRFRRPGDAPFRRGMGASGRTDDAAATGGYEPFRPEPEDAHARRPAGHDAQPPRVDRMAEREPEQIEPPPPPPPMAPEPAPYEPPPAAIEPEVVVEQAPDEPVWEQPPAAYVPPVEPVAPAAPAWPDESQYEPAEPQYEPQQPPYEYGPYDGGYQASDYADEAPPGGGFGPLAVVAVVALGLMAIGLGVVLSGVFSGVASASPSPSPTPIASVPATVGPTAEPTVAPTTTSAPTPSPTAGPVVFPDGFTAQTQPCADQPDSFSGCDSSGATVSGSSIWVWVGFRKGNDADVITATILDSGGTKVDDGSVTLSTISCGSSCNGWLRFRFTGLTPGNYLIHVDRNGQLAADSSFTVTG